MPILKLLFHLTNPDKGEFREMLFWLLIYWIAAYGIPGLIRWMHTLL